MTHITVTKGCICISWVISDHFFGEVFEDLGELLGYHDLLSRENSHLTHVCHLNNSQLISNYLFNYYNQFSDKRFYGNDISDSSTRIVYGAEYRLDKNRNNFVFKIVDVDKNNITPKKSPQKLILNLKDPKISSAMHSIKNTI